MEETLNGNADELKEYTLGVKALERRDSFDPRTDPIVRAEASRLRTRLALYYASEGQADAVAISLPRGSYVPVFESRSLNQAAAPVHADRRWKIAALVCAIVAVIAVWWSLRAKDRGLAPLRRFEIELRSGGSVGGSVGSDVAISPDGARMVFIAQDTNGVAHLYAMRLDQGNAVVLEGTEEEQIISLHRPADRAAELVLFQIWTRPPARIQEEVIRVENVVAHELPEVAMKIVRP